VPGKIIEDTPAESLEKNRAPIRTYRRGIFEVF